MVFWGQNHVDLVVYWSPPFCSNFSVELDSFDLLEKVKWWPEVAESEATWVVMLVDMAAFVAAISWFSVSLMILELLIYQSWHQLGYPCSVVVAFDSLWRWIRQLRTLYTCFRAVLRDSRSFYSRGPMSWGEMHVIWMISSRFRWDIFEMRTRLYRYRMSGDFSADSRWVWSKTRVKWNYLNWSFESHKCYITCDRINLAKSSVLKWTTFLISFSSSMFNNFSSDCPRML